MKKQNDNGQIDIPTTYAEPAPVAHGYFLACSLSKPTLSIDVRKTESLLMTLSRWNDGCMLRDLVRARDNLVKKSQWCNCGFALHEVLIAVLLLTIVAAFVAVVTNQNRKQSRSANCASNLRILAQANLMYANVHNERFFTQWNTHAEAVDNETNPDLQLWCDDKRLGMYINPKDVTWTDWDLAKRSGLNLQQAVDGIVKCPESDESERRSYGQNHWANGLGGLNKEMDESKAAGAYFSSNAENSDRLILFAERIAVVPTNSSSRATSIGWNGGWVSEVVGQYGRPSSRFSGYGFSLRPLRMPTRPPQRYAFQIPWILDYSRHGVVKDATKAEGKTHIAYVDGAVRLLDHTDIFNPKTGISHYNTLWSNIDREADKNVHPEILPK